MPKLRRLFSSLRGKNKGKEPAPVRVDRENPPEWNTPLNAQYVGPTPTSVDPETDPAKSRKKITASHTQAVAILRKNGFDLNARNYEALYWACLNGELEAVQLLLQLGIKPGIYYGYKSPLHAAAECGNCDIADALLTRGAYIMDTLPHGDMPLHAAVRRGNLEMVRFLLDRGADVHAAGNFGCTALHVAVRSGFEAIVNQLLEYEVDIEATDNSKRTPLHHAAIMNKYEMVKKLVELGANSEARDSKGKAPIHLAGEMGNRKAFEILRAEAKKVKERKQWEGNETKSWTREHHETETHQRPASHRESAPIEEHGAALVRDTPKGGERSELGDRTA
ncbi:hypothetical protein FQN54_009670 [Arachnomyces sp. PD_36]|nr:hypothetical protein FQN54_009670 [Arachnomyces sp. PD_36]